MHATDVIAWIYNGAIYCPDHKPAPNPNSKCMDEVEPVLLAN
jgi:hypothetical protein